MSTPTRDREATYPQPALVLGVAGLIPFFAAAIACWWPGDGVSQWAFQVLLAYGAVILSFLGGVRWGVALHDADQSSMQPWLFSILPSLAGWVGVLSGGSVGLGVLVLGFVAQWVYDRAAMAHGKLPRWFGKLRSLLTAGAVLSLLVGGLA